MSDLLFKLWFADLKLKNEDKVNLLIEGISPECFFRMSVNDYIQLGFNIVKAEELSRSKELDKYTKIEERILEEGINYMSYDDENYPVKLKNIYNPPVGFFTKGEVVFSQPSIAIVGSRRASEYGKTAAFQMGYELGKRGITVVSGLAKGIDSCAHRGCLDSNGYTLGVMGSGFNNIYPTDNKGLFEEITLKGCMITEYLPDMPPMQYNFPERNRIISGLSDFILVIEAGERSGSLITAHLALEQGKDVFAVPGNIYSPNSKGTNKLIKDGAKPVLEIQDILEEFNVSFENNERTNLNITEVSVLDALKTGAMTIDDIFQRTGMEVDVLLTTVSRLECGGYIKRVYGNYYMIS